MALSEAEIAEILSSAPLERPAKSGIKAKDKFLLRIKRGGKMQFVTATCKGDPFLKRLEGGKTAHYVEVFGWGFRRTVNITKLRVIPTYSAKGRS